MSFFNKLGEGLDSLKKLPAVAKGQSGMDFVTKVVGHARAEVIGIWNPNRRHDDPEEQAQDALRAEIRAGHRFTSFAGERSENTVKWHVDGHDYMWAVSEMIDSAREAIFILDWWLTPELYLRRPPAHYPEWRLDRLLQRKAEQGVKIHVVVYKEVTQTMSMSSKHTKNTLERLHPNISCMRHPDHIGAKDSVQFWSHHEKVVVVDNHYAAVGGLDLCFGRWDTHNHPLADVHPTDFSKTLFPGQDYNNARVMDFKDVFNYASNTISILDTGRMPWHDVHMTLEGPAVLDVSQHFIERWNEIKKRKYREKENVPWLALPHEPEYAPNEAAALRQATLIWINGVKSDRNTRNVGTVRPLMSVVNLGATSDSAQLGRELAEFSIQAAYIQMIAEAEHYIFIENQFFISNTQSGCSVTNLIAKALVERILRAAREGSKFKVVVAIPEVPGFAGDVKDESSIRIIMGAQYRTINRGGNSIYEVIRAAGYEPMDFIRFYHLRAYDRINAPKGFISAMEQNSGVTFHQAQVAMAKQWVDGDQLTDQKDITLSAAAQEGGLVNPKAPAPTITVPIPANTEEARQTVARFESGARNLRSDERVSDNVVQHMLNDKTGLLDEIWLGTEQEELDAYVSEALYIHSKLMIVDDRRVIMGSANINDRSQKGDGDSEIALVVEDDDMIDSTMDGQPYQHLGLIRPQNCDGRDRHPTPAMRPAPFPNEDDLGTEEDNLVADPICDATDYLWKETARKNREIFSEIFRPIPTNLVRSAAAYDNYRPKVKTGHVVPDIPLQRVKERLSQVKGALVECPLDFLIEDKGLVSGPEWTVINPTLPIYI